MKDERAQEVSKTFQERFLPSRDAEWQASYRGAVEAIQAATEAQFRSPAFQQRLWELTDIASVGLGKSVAVPGAYVDSEIVEALWRLRTWTAPDDPLARARASEAEFQRILGLVSPRHNARRPSARLARIFAALRPRDSLCLLDGYRTRYFRQWLEQPAHKLGFIGQHVILRQALREILGPETDWNDDVLYSMFSWYVWDHLLKPVEAAAEGEVVGESRATDIPSLTILPAKVQRKGINYLSNNLDLLLAMLRAAEHGIDREALSQQIAEEAPGLKQTSRASLMAQAASLALLSFENGTYRPTAAGRALLEGDPPAEVLAPVMVRGVFGFAQILDDLSRNGTMSRGAIAQACRLYYPRWTSDFAPNQLVAWMRDLGLVSIEGVGAGAGVTLTESGEYWRSGLPADLKIPTLLLSDERPDDKTALEEEDQVVDPNPSPLTSPPLAAVLERFRANDRLKALVFSDLQIGLVHAALHAVQGKRFVLLAGLSGTGKTSMARGYAQAYCEALGLPVAGHYEQVAVWPDWTDPTGLLGFVNPLANPPTFQETDTLRLLLAAASNPDKPYFLCLDEMNLARVEHYFAPFLSAMEGQGRLTLHAGREAVDAVPPAIPWPRNLFILGTVNMDETTHPFSDKVLDRAFTFEFWDVDLPGWRRAAEASGVDAATIKAVYPVLNDFTDALKPARRHFGYRTCDEVLGFLQGWPGPPSEALDAAVLAKVLPKVRGEAGGALPDAIDRAIEVCTTHNLPASRSKLEQMRETLNEFGAVRFWA